MDPLTRTHQIESATYLHEKQVASSYLLVHIFSFPLWGLLYLLPAILYKNCVVSEFQVATVIALKPMVSLFSPYWSQLVHGKRYRLVSNLTWANLIKFLPFVFAPVIKGAWILIICFGSFMMLSRGTIPAWMELLKSNLPEHSRNRICAVGSTIDFLGTALVPILFGWILDHYDQSWRWLFAATAGLGLLSTVFILRIRRSVFSDLENSGIQQFSLSVLAPWKNGVEILRKNRSFLRFQVGFFLGGAGLMIVQPILPKFFLDTLQLSYTEMLMAIAACKGIGFALSAPVWVKKFEKIKIFSLCALVTSVAALFPFILALAPIHRLFIYLGYFLYGIMQGGSELIWKTSGIYFSSGGDSTPFSSVNILMVGIRGLIIPYLGSLFFILSGSYLALMVMGALLSISAAAFMKSYSRKFHRVSSS